MECMYAQTRPQFILSLERVLGDGVRIHIDSNGCGGSRPDEIGSSLESQGLKRSELCPSDL